MGAGGRRLYHRVNKFPDGRRSELETDVHRLEGGGRAGDNGVITPPATSPQARWLASCLRDSRCPNIFYAASAAACTATGGPGRAAAAGALHLRRHSPAGKRYK